MKIAGGSIHRAGGSALCFTSMLKQVFVCVVDALRERRVISTVRTMALRRLKTASRFAAWCCIIAVAVLSLTPAEQMMRTGVGGHVEHVLAYAGTAFITAMAFAERGLSRIALALVTYAAGLEFLQRFSPGRTSSIGDFMFSGAGVLMGIAAFALLAKWLARSIEPAS